MSEWKLVRLGQAIELLTGFPFKSAQYTDSEHDILLLRGDNIGQGYLRWENAKRWPADNTQELEDYFLQESDVILAMDRPWIEAGLKFACISQNDLPCLLVQRVSCLRAKEGLNQTFLRYVIQGYPFTQYIVKTQTGTAVPHISGNQIKDFEFLLPSLTEQKEIAKTLVSLDRKISNLRQQNETLEKIAQTLFNHWFVDFEFPNEDGKPYKSSGGKMVRSEEFWEIPEGWRVGRLADFGKVITGKTPSTQNSTYWGKGLPFVTPTDFKNYGKFTLRSEREISQIAVSEFSQLIIPEQSVIVTCIGSDMGKVARAATPCITNQQINSLLFDKMANGIEYVYQYLVSQYKILRLMALGGSTMPIINKTDFSSIKIVIPNDAILDKFNQPIESLNLKIINNEHQIQTLTQTRDRLLPKLMSGQLRIPA